jgi:hypothetical protein
MSATNNAEDSADQEGRDAFGGSVVAQMGDLRAAYRWRDVRQISVVAHDMRVWDEDGVHEQDAADFGEFVVKVRACMCKSRLQLYFLQARRGQA